MGFRAIGRVCRVLGVSNVTVRNWIRAAGAWIKNEHDQNKDKHPSSSVEVIELDEMWHFVKAKEISYGNGLHWSGEGVVYLALLQEAGKQ